MVLDIIILLPKNIFIFAFVHNNNIKIWEFIYFLKDYLIRLNAKNEFDQYEESIWYIYMDIDFYVFILS